MSTRYVQPGWFTTNVFNRLVHWLTRLGISVYGSRTRAVRGRTSGEWRTTPVNLLTFEGERYLVAPRGVTQWVRNIRVSGEGTLRLGRGHEPVRVVELGDDEKPALLRAYLRRWKFEIGAFFQGVGPDASEEDIRRIAPATPSSESCRPNSLHPNRTLPHRNVGEGGAAAPGESWLPSKGLSAFPWQKCCVTDEDNRPRMAVLRLPP